MKIKPCKNCGKIPELTSYTCETCDDLHYYFDCCNIFESFYSDEDDAIEEWNAKSDNPRPYTDEEVLTMLINKLRTLSTYWAEIENSKLTTQERLDGLLFSILSALDGSSYDLPGFKLLIDLPKEDRIPDGEKYFKHGQWVNKDCPLHEFLVWIEFKENKDE